MSEKIKNSHSHHHHHRTKKEKIKQWLKDNWKWLFILLVVLIFILAFIVDRNKKEIDNVKEDVVEVNSNYDAIITVIDGEGESTFTEVWGSLIEEGYPICSDLVTDYVGKDGYMDWDTIKALSNVGVEFVFHSSAHSSYNGMSNEKIIEDIERGIKAMDDHGLEHRSICWLATTSEDRCELGRNYFDVGITDNPSVSTLGGNKSNPMMVADIFGSSNDTYFTYQQLKNYIDVIRGNNGWLVLFTRNNHKMMDETQINIYRQAFEYAKEHNVAVVTASEGYDLYYGNKLDNK